jgi:hypothetical protein
MKPKGIRSAAAQQLMWLLLLILGDVMMTYGKSNSLLSENHVKADTDVPSVLVNMNRSKSNEVAPSGVSMSGHDVDAVVASQSKVVSRSWNHSKSHSSVGSANHSTSTNHSNAPANTTLTFTTNTCNGTSGMKLQMEFSSTVLENGMYCCSTCCGSDIV